ncbi:short-chain fatty acid transporter [Rubeoparvulum massiliense]|uniref:short-chain fatty acid transporter n=1 Tax=Rubeoparvulum massiliense TaxID=1631346 RepID=UPI00065E935B|nr:short-chain fatty acid transporter [Rubeoparvulum massiliense]
MRLVSRYLPDPYLFAVGLTLIVFLWGMAIGNTPLQMVEHWGKGFWELLAFSMQMVMILVTGHTLANTLIFKRSLKSLAAIAKGPASAIILTTFVSAIAAWVNWGFGLVIGALLVKEVAKQVERVDYRLPIVSAYSGFLLWHGGFSGSIPLTIATEGHFSEDIIGIIPASETIFAPFNLIIVLVLLIGLPLVNRLMIPDAGQEVSFRNFVQENESVATMEVKMTPADRLENSRWISFLISLLGFANLFSHFWTKGFKLDLNIVNLLFLFLGILLHGAPKRFLEAVGEAVKGTTGIIIQFLFYAGIMGMMVNSGLAGLISQWYVSISTASTFPLWSAGLINIFVPSGGGQWAVQAGIMLPAGLELGVDAAKTAMAVAWGDAWTNMIQPFWALPALGIAGLGARDIMGYCMMVLLFSGIVISLGFLLL